MDSARKPASPATSSRTSSQGDALDGWPVAERALSVLATDVSLTPTLTERLLGIARGFSRRRISESHGISLNTVKTQVNAVLDSLGVSCCHEIRDAATAACARAQAGASEDEILRFLRLRLE